MYNIPERFDLQSFITKSIYGTVHRAKDTETGKDVIVKISNIKLADSHSNNRSSCICDDVRRECAMLRYINEPKIAMPLVMEFVDETNHYCITEYAKGGDFFDYIRLSDEAHITSKTKDWFKELANIVYYLHREKFVAHMDLSLENIVVDNDLKLHLIDFGSAIVHPNAPLQPDELLTVEWPVKIERFAKEMNILQCKLLGTVNIPGKEAYQSPELVNGGKCDAFANDIWALGVVFYIIMYGNLPFKNTNRGSSIGSNSRLKHILSGIWLNNIKKFTGSSETKDPKYLKLIDSMLKPENTRITIEEVLRRLSE